MIPTERDREKTKGRRWSAVGQTLCFRWEDKTKAFVEDFSLRLPYIDVSS